MIKIHTNSVILYYAALVPNIGVKFRNIGCAIEFDFSLF